MRLVSVLQIISLPYVLGHPSDSCYWNPFQNLYQESCRPSEQDSSLTESSNQTFTHRLERPPAGEIRQHIIEEDAWKGPHSCAGKYCVWSNEGFSGQGISIVTTATNSRHVKRLPSIDNGDENASSPFRVARIPGKGTGLVATRKIRRGERIMAEPPAMLTNRQFIAEVQLEDQYRLLDMAVGKLPKVRRQSFMEQAAELGGHHITDIIFTNSYQTSLGLESDSFHFGTYPDASRINHDCRPNLAFYIDKNLSHHTHAVRDINLGEELTVSYLDSFQPRSVRQERARASWGFSCACSQCSLPKEEADASDARLVSISIIENALSDFSNTSVSPAWVERLIALCREERLDFKIAGVLTTASLNYNIFGDAKMAKKYALLAVEAGLLEHGPDAPDVQAMRVLANDPEGHFSWNRKPADR